MSTTESLRRQHTELLRISAELRSALTPGLELRARDLRRTLSKLSGVLSVHLRLEDWFLYPKLAKHRNPAVKLLTEQYLREMGGLKDIFAAHDAKWRSREFIERNPGAFARETIAILDALAKRISREDSELYELVDQCGIE